MFVFHGHVLVSNGNRKTTNIIAQRSARRRYYSLTNYPELPSPFVAGKHHYDCMMMKYKHLRVQKEYSFTLAENTKDISFDSCTHLPKGVNLLTTRHDLAEDSTIHARLETAC